MRLENKVAIITGASSGIGLEVAKAYVKEGAKITICSPDQNGIDKAKAEILEQISEAEVLAIKADITNTEEIKNLIEQTIKNFGKLDILINNAGIAPAKSVEETTDSDFEKVISINLTGAFKCTREALPYLKENGGSIINTSSFVSLYGSPNQCAYSASKAAMNGLTKSNAKELGKYKIRVNAIAPGVVMTDMVKDNCDPKTIERLNMMTPIGRPASPNDLTGLYIYLGSDESLVTTGTIINVDGGLIM